MVANVHEIEGDLFDAPDGAALIHACNTQGSWGAGIAKAFRLKYPAAYEKYRSHCRRYSSRPESKNANGPATTTKPDATTDTTLSRRLHLPEGTALIIPPQRQDVDRNGKSHWIICLFTSQHFGRNKSSPRVILENTALALADMNRQLARLGAESTTSGDGEGEAEPGRGGEKPTMLWSCRFNAGLFGVDWKLSRRVLEDQGVEVTVVRPPRA